MFKILIIIFIFSFPLKADQYDLRLEELFDQLLNADDEKEIYRITVDIWDIWHQTSDTNIKSDFVRGVGLMNNGNLEISLNYFTRVISKNPNFAEAWNKRATVYYMLGEFDKSMYDINETLRLEPRHFGALDGMALIFIHQKKYNKAIKVYEEIIKIFPKSKKTQEKKQKILDYISKQA